MATGLGKTWLAAFDTMDAARTLFIAHREAILQQSLEVFRRVQPERDLGLATGSHSDLDAEVLFASVQWLHRNLDRIEPTWFERVVVDEFHHAAARSYRKVLDHLRPQFLLGITATLERLDGADLLALTGDNVFEVGLVEGIDRGDLVPFRYIGVPDEAVGYAPIPLRGWRFAERELTEAVSTGARADHVLETWRAEGGGRTLAFCVTTAHADFMARHFSESGVLSAAVHTAPSSAARRGLIEQLERGELEVVFSVDLFSEGLDVPSIETVLMLRPTQSPVVFLQQLGRGLRPSEGKDRLLVIDFIGNHRSFFDRPRMLLDLFGDQEPDPERALQLLHDREVELPTGCEIDVPLETIRLLERLRRTGRRSALESYVLARVEETGERPTAVQCLRAGYNRPACAAVSEAGSTGWQGSAFWTTVRSRRRRRPRRFSGRSQREQIQKSFKLLTLRAMVRRSWLWEPAPIDELGLLADPRLLRDVADESSPDPQTASHEAWRAYVRKNPVAAWAGEMRSDPSTAPFEVVDEGLRAKLDVPERLREAVEELVAELVD